MSRWHQGFTASWVAPAKQELPRGSPLSLWMQKLYFSPHFFPYLSLSESFTTIKPLLSNKRLLCFAVPHRLLDTSQEGEPQKLITAPSKPVQGGVKKFLFGIKPILLFALKRYSSHLGLCCQARFSSETKMLVTQLEMEIIKIRGMRGIKSKAAGPCTQEGLNINR